VFRGKDSPIALRDLPPLLAAALLPLIPIVSEAGLLAALPLLALIVPLLFGCFPGERAIQRLAERRPARPRARRTVPAAVPRPVAFRTLLRTRLLIATSFAKRPPPALITAS
jgi:hypothetical protein